MHFPTGSLHPTFVTEALRLKEKSHTEGEVPRHADILKQVAEKNGAASWQELFADSWNAPFDNYFAPERPCRYPRITVPIEEVLYSTAIPEKVFFGGREGKGLLPYISRFGMEHVLLVGDTTPGCSDLVSFLLLQNMARGGGALYLDAAGHGTDSYRLKKFAGGTGVPFQYLDRVKVVHDEALLTNVVRNREFGFLQLSFLTDEIDSQIYLEQVFEQLKRILSASSIEYPRKAPLFVVVPEAQRLPVSGLGLLLRRAAEVGVTFIFTVANLDTVSLTNKALLDALLQFTGHKVFFGQANAYAAASAAQLLAPYRFVDKPRFMKNALQKVLVDPGLHEALVLSKEEVSRVLVPYLYTRDWATSPM